MIVSLNKITKVFNGKDILKDINAVIEDRDRIGLIGVNGAGKSTLLNIICGKLNADSGEFSKNPQKKIGYLEQNSGLESSSTIYNELKNVFNDILSIQSELKSLEKQMSTAKGTEYDGISKKYAALLTFFEQKDGYNIDVKIKMMLNGMGFSDKNPDTVVSTLSGGEKTRLKMAKLLLEQPELLILDEPTNHLDFKTVAWLEEYLTSYKGALLTVSHDRYFLNKTVTSMWEIENLTLSVYPGNYSKYISLKEERTQRAIKEYEAQQKEVASLEEYVAKNMVRASTSKSAKSRQNSLDKMVRLEKPSFYNKRAKIEFTAEKEPVKDILDVTDLNISVGGKQLCENVNIHLLKGEKIALVGANGIGKSTFLKQIQKLLPLTKGKVTWGKNVKIGYYDQELSGFNPRSTVIDELWNRNKALSEFEIRSALGGVLLTGENVYKQVRVISGGEKAKLAFAELMLQKANVLILDEPTNHLDMYTKEILEKALCTFDGTVILVSHDRYLLNRVPTKIAELTQNGFEIFPGNFDSYNEKKSMPKPSVKVEEALKEPAPKSKEQRRAAAQNKDKSKKTEAEIQKTEEAILQAEKALEDPVLAADYIKVEEKCTELSSLKEHLSKLYEDWYSCMD